MLTIVMTAAMPMTMPSSVSAERMRFRSIARTAASTAMRKTFIRRDSSASEAAQRERRDLRRRVAAVPERDRDLVASSDITGQELSVLFVLRSDLDVDRPEL